MQIEPRLGGNCKHDAAFLRDRLVEFADVSRDGRGVEITHAFAPGACLRAGDA